MSLSLLNGFVGDIVQGIKEFFYGILYAILKALCYVIDLCQILVKKLAGIEVDGMLFNGQVVNGSESSTTVTGDIVEALIRTDVVRNLFISLLVLGIILLLIVTFVGVWKSEWEFGKEGNSKSKIINASMKALFNFIAVPVIAMFGIFVGNALLRAIDGATKGDENKSITSFVLSSAFADACVYNYRFEGNNNQWVNANLQVVYEKDSEGNIVYDANGDPVMKYQGILNLFKDSRQDVHVDEILEAFQNNQKISKKTVEDGKYRIFSYDGEVNEKYTQILLAGEFKFSFDDSDLVGMFFDNSKINYILMYIILFFMIKAMLTITFGLVKRLYYVVILFIISPPIVAMSPINDKALGSWRSAFIKNLCSAFVTIGIYNIFLSIYPIFKKISFPGVGNFVNFFVQLLMISVGLMTINSISSKLSDIFGVGDVYSESVNKDGKSLWGGAFEMAGSGFKPFTFGAQVIGKGVQYGMTAKYMGLGAAVKQMGKDATGAINKTPVGDFMAGSGAKNVLSQAKTNHGILHSDDAKNYREDKQIDKIHSKAGTELVKLMAEEEARNNYIQKNQGIIDTYEKYKDTYGDENLKYDVMKYNLNEKMLQKAYKDNDQSKIDYYQNANSHFSKDRLQQIQEYNNHKQEFEDAKNAIDKIDREKLAKAKAMPNESYEMKKIFDQTGRTKIDETTGKKVKVSREERRENAAKFTAREDAKKYAAEKAKKEAKEAKKSKK